MSKLAEELTLGDMAELLRTWEDSYQLTLPQVRELIFDNTPVVAVFLRDTLAQLYIHGLISIADMERLAIKSMSALAQWAYISFSIGLEAGLGKIEEDEILPYLYACNRPYICALLHLASQLDRKAADQQADTSRVTELNRAINAMSLSLADMGRSFQAGKLSRYHGGTSAVATFLHGIDVTTIREDIAHGVEEIADCEPA